MALDFPATPTDGQLYVGANGVTYQWSTAKGLWLSMPQAIQNLGQGDFSAKNGSATSLSSTLLIIKPDTIISGNSGGWYSVSTGRYTPPAGRYFITASVGGNAAGQSGMVLHLYKNGVSQLVSAGNIVANSFSTACTVGGVFDANGTDYFEIYGTNNIGQTVPANYIMFSAIPVGVVVANANANARLLIAEAISNGSPAELIVNVPPGLRSVELEFEVSTAADTTAYLQIRNASGNISGANYTREIAYGASSSGTAGAVMEQNQTQWALSGSTSTWHGTFNGIMANSGRSDNFNLHGVFGTLGTGVARQTIMQHMDYYFGSNNQRQTITGFRFFAGAAFLAGSVVRAYGMV